MTAPMLAAPGTTTAVLEARSLTKHFPVHGRVPGAGRRLARAGRPAPVVHAVDDVSLALTAGSVTAVVGESGSGKSTLARLMSRLITPTSGELLLHGRAVPRSQRRHLDYAKTVQMVLQDPFASLNPIHDVHYHLSRPFKVHGMAGSAADLDAKIAAVLDRVALTPADLFVHKYPHELSGGQRQRVMIAMALALHPSLMIADEPTTALDLTIQAQIVELLVRLRSEHGLAVLLITHDLALVAEVAKRVIVMYAGHVMEEGPLRSIYEDAHNPYTRALLNSTPSGMGESEMAVAPIPGSPPSPANRGSGCAFATRCYMATELCSSKRPPLAPVAMDDGVESSSRTWKSACHYRDAVREPSRA